jgi:hypothetical protein
MFLVLMIQIKEKYQVGVFTEGMLMIFKFLRLDQLVSVTELRNTQRDTPVGHLQGSE